MRVEEPGCRASRHHATIIRGEVVPISGVTRRPQSTYAHHLTHQHHFPKTTVAFDKEIRFPEFREINIFSRSSYWLQCSLYREKRPIMHCFQGRSHGPILCGGGKTSELFYCVPKPKATHEKLHVVRFEDLVIEREKHCRAFAAFSRLKSIVSYAGGQSQLKMPAYDRRTHFDSRTVVEKDINLGCRRYLGTCAIRGYLSGP